MGTTTAAISKQPKELTSREPVSPKGGGGTQPCSYLYGGNILPASNPSVPLPRPAARQI
jgi:hypothetical protein